MHLCVITPAVLRVPALLEATKRSWLSSTECAHGDATISYVLAVNAWDENKMGVPAGVSIWNYLRQEMYKVIRPSDVGWIIDGGGSVSSAWNRGIVHGQMIGADMFLFLGNDCELDPAALLALIDYGQDNPDVDIWSAVRASNARAGEVTEGCDFSVFCARPRTFDRFGTFDCNFFPAYFEDNDYCARVWLGGGSALAVHNATYTTQGSGTIKLDSLARREVNARFNLNRIYFERKWNAREPSGSRDEVRKNYYAHPFNDRGKPLSWWNQE